MQKKLWICLILSKNLYSKYRFFALFRRACCHGVPGEKPRALPAGASLTDLRVCPHTTLLPHKKPVLTCVNTGLTCMLCGAPSLHALTCMLCGARTHTPCTRAPHPLPVLTRSARRRPWRRAQRTAVPARERSRQRPEPHGRCARPRQDGFRRRSEALQ